MLHPWNTFRTFAFIFTILFGFGWICTECDSDFSDYIVLRISAQTFAKFQPFFCENSFYDPSTPFKS